MRKKNTSMSQDQIHAQKNGLLFASALVKNLINGELKNITRTRFPDQEAIDRLLFVNQDISELINQELCVLDSKTESFL